MLTTKHTPAARQWQRLGNTLLDLSQVVKIEFERPDARLFVISGEALLIAAWTESRAEVSQLKQLSSIAAGWVSVEVDAQESDGVSDYSADVDPTDDSSDAETGVQRSGNSGFSPAGQNEETRALRADASDHRVRLSAIDRLVYISTAAGPALDLFSSGVFLGQVSDSGSIADVETFLDK